MTTDDDRPTKELKRQGKLLVSYVAHPVGQPPDRAPNLARVRRWLRWLIAENPNIAFCLPWLPYCDVMPESVENRDRGLRDDIAMLRRCDAIVLVGGTLSPGMAMELEIAKACGLQVVDYLHLGDEPPMGAL